MAALKNVFMVNKTRLLKEYLINDASIKQINKGNNKS